MHLELSILAAFGAMLCWGIGDFLIQRTARRVGDIETLAFIGIIGSFGMLPFVIGDFRLLLDMRNIGLLALLGVITFIAALLDFEALKKGKLSVMEVILEIELPVTVILGFVFFQESLSFVQIAVITGVLAGIVLIASGSSPRKSLKTLEKGAVLAFMSAIGMGFVNFLTAAGSKQISPLMAVWFPWVVLSVICLLLLWKREGEHKLLENAARFKWLIIATGIFDTAAWIFFAYAVFGNMLSITIAITESYPAVALLLGLKVNRERIGQHQCWGAGIALMSSFMLGFLV